jgi:hypothetical protein
MLACRTGTDSRTANAMGVVFGFMEWRLSWNTENKSSRAFLREFAGVPAIIHPLAVADGGHVAG